MEVKREFVSLTHLLRIYAVDIYGNLVLNWQIWSIIELNRGEVMSHAY